MTDQFPDKTASLTDSDRMALAVCVASLPGSSPCKTPCNACRQSSAATAHVIGQILRERHGGSSTTADWLDGVGCHPRGGVATVTTPKQPGWGLRILKVRNTTGIPEALILPPDHEAPYWADLRQIAQHQARAIYEPLTPSTK